MSDSEIASLPAGRLAADSCALLMWIPFPLLVEARHLAIFDAWGFRPVTVVFVWNKVFRNSNPYCGLGFYTRSGAEPCLLGIKGKIKRKAKGIRQVVTEVVRRHSQKPDVFYHHIENLFDGPYMELFARRRNRGWDCWGNQVPGFIQSELPEPK
jgi:N6-adenosine-specific RNA methylase IME4